MANSKNDDKELFGKNLWDKILSRFSEITKMALHILDSQGNYISEPHRPEYCVMMRENTEMGSGLCKRCNIVAIEKAWEAGKPIFYTCHAQCVNISIPILIDGQKMVLLGEGLLSEEVRAEKFEHFLEYARKVGASDPEALVKARKKMRVYRELKYKDERSRLAEILEQVRIFCTIEEINRLVSTSLELDKVLDIILIDGLELIRKSKPKYVEYISLIDEEKKDLVVVAGQGDGFVLNKMPRLKIGEGIAGWVAQEGEPYLSNNVLEDQHYHTHFNFTKSELAVPLSYREKVIGVINFESSEKNTFSKKDIKILIPLAEQAAIAIVNAQLFENSQRTIKALSKINIINERLSVGAKVEDILELTVTTMNEILKAEVCSLFLAKENRKNLVLKATTSSKFSKRINKAEYEFGVGLTGSVAETGKPIRIQDTTKDPRWIGKCMELHPAKTQAFLCIPIRFKGEVIGVIRFVNKKDDKFPVFTKQDEQLAINVATVIALAIKNALMEKKRIHDERLIATGKMAGEVAHHIGNPLGIIRTSAQLLSIKCTRSCE